jgi:lactobin A/cerein 7B family class IIb bacteriocin
MEQQESWTETQQSSEESYMASPVLTEQELLNVVGGAFPIRPVVGISALLIVPATIGYLAYRADHG